MSLKLHSSFSWWLGHFLEDFMKINNIHPKLVPCNSYASTYNKKLIVFRPFGAFTQRVRFCYYGAERDMIRTSCDENWEFNFNLFGGNNETENTIKIYNYFLNAPDSHSSNVYLNSSSIPSELKPFQPNPIYVPGEA